ncbi:hypothetical protein B0H10DRAFT_1974766 [Mycena sp. CBHHK59/15]|nr:hypothetical protein B0H10DRAFT_1974766 [Mycena sp. CBHHK59/15]
MFAMFTILDTISAYKYTKDGQNHLNGPIFPLFFVFPVHCSVLVVFITWLKITGPTHPSCRHDNTWVMGSAMRYIYMERLLIFGIALALQIVLLPIEDSFLMMVLADYVFGEGPSLDDLRVAVGGDGGNSGEVVTRCVTKIQGLVTNFEVWAMWMTEVITNYTTKPVKVRWIPEV